MSRIVDEHGYPYDDDDFVDEEQYALMEDRLGDLEFKTEATSTTPRILDSGTRREFETGAVRDICEGKGRCDLLPLDVVGEWCHNDILGCVSQFQIHGTDVFLYEALKHFAHMNDWDVPTLLLEVSKHFEEGCKKYGDNNWQKGIPANCYLDSALRHYLKWRRGDNDEPHDRAFVWNIMCCIWEVEYHD